MGVRGDVLRWGVQCFVKSNLKLVVQCPVSDVRQLLNSIIFLTLIEITMFGLRLQCVLLLSKLQIVCSNLYNLHPCQATTTFCSNQMSQHTADPNYLPVHLHRKTIEQKRIVSLIVSFCFSILLLVNGWNCLTTVRWGIIVITILDTFIQCPVDIPIKRANHSLPTVL